LVLLYIVEHNLGVRENSENLAPRNCLRLSVKKRHKHPDVRVKKSA
jgi:hypothetical protein